MNIEDLNLQEIYSKKYFFGYEYMDYLKDRNVFEKQFQERIYQVRKFLPEGKLIEIGCAYGFFLSVAKEYFQVQGYDISEEAVMYAKNNLNVDARCEDFIDAAVTPESVDLITMWDTIEHLKRPDLTVAKVIRVLRPGGFLFLTTGDISSLIARIRRGKWRLIHPPTHIHYFSRGSMVRMLEVGGLEIIRIKYVGIRRSVRQIAYSLLELGKRQRSRIRQIIMDSRIGDLSFVLNTYDIMLVVARKSNRHHQE